MLIAASRVLIVSIILAVPGARQWTVITAIAQCELALIALSGLALGIHFAHWIWALVLTLTTALGLALGDVCDRRRAFELSRSVRISGDATSSVWLWLEQLAGFPYILLVVASPFNALVVHAQEEALGELVEILTSPSLAVDTARSITEAMRKIRSGTINIIVVDHKPPVLDGIALLEASAAYVPNALRILVVGSPEEAAYLDRRPDQSKLIVRFVGHASERSRLVALVHEGLHLMQLVEEQRALVAKLSGEHRKLQNREKLLDVVVRERTAELEESYEKLKAANRQALFGLAEAIETKDPYTKGHCGRVAAYSMVLAEAAGYPEDGMETLEFGAFLHDIGKIGVRDAVLLKPGPLDEAEWMHMREHPVMGSEIASKIEMLKTIIPAVRNHHERWDGKGYPDRMVGEEIPFVARIVAIADAYDAMATDRPYKIALPLDECEALLRKNAGKMFDAGLVEIFTNNHLGAIYDEKYDDQDYEDGYAEDVDVADG